MQGEPWRSKEGEIPQGREEGKGGEGDTMEEHEGGGGGRYLREGRGRGDTMGETMGEKGGGALGERNGINYVAFVVGQGAGDRSI